MKIGIIGAMQEEVESLISSMENVKKKTKASMDFYEGRLWGNDTVVVMSGIGKVNMAVCAQILIDPAGKVVDDHLKARFDPPLKQTVHTLHTKSRQRPHDHRSHKHGNVRSYDDPHRCGGTYNTATVAVKILSSCITDQCRKQIFQHWIDQYCDLLIWKPSGF